jgi:uncharacterized membrane protein YgcG
VARSHEQLYGSKPEYAAIPVKYNHVVPGCTVHLNIVHAASPLLWGYLSQRYLVPLHNISQREEHLRYVVEGVQITLAKITPKKRRGSVDNSGSKRARSFPSRGGGGGRGGYGGASTGRGGGTAASVRGQRGGY